MTSSLMIPVLNGPDDRDCKQFILSFKYPIDPTTFEARSNFAQKVLLDMPKPIVPWTEWAAPKIKTPLTFLSGSV